MQRMEKIRFRDRPAFFFRHGKYEECLETLTRVAHDVPVVGIENHQLASYSQLVRAVCALQTVNPASSLSSNGTKRKRTRADRNTDQISSATGALCMLTTELEERLPTTSKTYSVSLALFQIAAYNASSGLLREGHVDRAVEIILNALQRSVVLRINLEGAEKSCGSTEALIVERTVTLLSNAGCQSTDAALCMAAAVCLACLGSWKHAFQLSERLAKTCCCPDPGADARSRKHSIKTIDELLPVLQMYALCCLRQGEASKLLEIRRISSLIGEGTQSRSSAMAYLYGHAALMGGHTQLAEQQFCQSEKESSQFSGEICNIKGCLAVHAGDMQFGLSQFASSAKLGTRSSPSALFNLALLYRESSPATYCELLLCLAEKLKIEKSNHRLGLLALEGDLIAISSLGKAVAYATIRLEEVLRAAAQACLSIGAWAQAVESLSKLQIAEHHHWQEEDLHDYLYALLQNGEYQKVVDIAYEKRIAAKENPIILSYLADAHFSLGNIDDSAHCLNQCLTIIDSMSKTVEEGDGYYDWLEDLKLQALNNKALIMVCEGNVDAAATLLKGCNLPSTSANGSKMSLNIPFNFAMLLMRQGKMKDACIVWLSARSVPLDDTDTQLEALQELRTLRSQPNWRPATIESNISSLAPDGCIDSVSIVQVQALDNVILEYTLAMSRALDDSNE